MTSTSTGPGTTTGVDAGAGAGTAEVTVRYFAAAQAAAGREEERRALPAGVTVGAFLDDLAAAHGPELERVLALCSLLVDGQARTGRDEPVAAPGAPTPTTVDVLPPFAGG